MNGQKVNSILDWMQNPVEAQKNGFCLLLLEASQTATSLLKDSINLVKTRIPASEFIGGDFPFDQSLSKQQSRENSVNE